MKLYCRFSGIEYSIADTFGSYQHVSIHPFFELPVKFYFSRAGDWAANRLHETERKLLFLGLLNSTDLVHFKHPAFPSDALVQQSMEKCMKIVSWITALKNPAVLLPQFSITKETCKLENIGHWLDCWYEARKDFEDGYVATSHLAKLRNREYALERLIRNAHKKVDDYSGLLAAWAMDAASVPKNLHEYWKPIFTTKGVSVYGLKQADIEECLEHMEEHLEHGSIYANAVLKHLRGLAKKNKQGLAFGLGMEDSEFQNLDLDALSKQPFKIVEDSVETANKEEIASRATEDRPQAKDYPSRVAYLRAKIAWEMAEKARRYAQEFAQQVETQLEIDEQINNEAGELDEENSGRSDELLQDAANDSEMDDER